MIQGCISCGRRHTDMWERSIRHDDNLRKFLKRARECRLKLNKKKCRFHMTELPYIGHIITSEGVKPDPKKVCAPWKRPETQRK